MDPIAPKLSQEGVARLVQVMDEASKVLPGCGLTITTPQGIVFEYYTGKFDVLDSSSSAKIVDKNTIMFFASTTKLLTSIAILQLVDAGRLTLDTPASKYLPELKSPHRIIDSFSSSGEPVYREAKTEITIGMMLNQSSGFGAEFAATVTQWKKSLPEGAKGKGFVNSCKIDNLIHTPLTEEPGTLFQYGNSAEWLGLLIQHVTGQSLEDYMQKNIFSPLGMKNTSFLPFDEETASRLMPLRWYNAATRSFEVLTDQFPGLTLPRTKSDIEYVVGGGGIYSTCSDYVLVLQDILRSYVDNEPSKILSPKSIASLFTPTLAESARRGITEMMGELYGTLEVGHLDWSTGMCLYLKDEPRCGWGRRKGSAGWAGAGSTEYWIDPTSRIACVWSSNVLPPRLPLVTDYKFKVERAIYEALSE